jgi:hypothetical protein
MAAICVCVNVLLFSKDVQGMIRLDMKLLYFEEELCCLDFIVYKRVYLYTVLMPVIYKQVCYIAIVMLL